MIRELTGSILWYEAEAWNSCDIHGESDLIILDEPYQRT